MEIKRIVLTGGPCGGKTSGIAKLVQSLEDRGYKVVVMDEMATNLIKSGLNPMVVSNSVFQEMLLRLQLDRDTVYDKVIDKLSKDRDIVVIYDRGLLDGEAFIGEDGFNEVLKSVGVRRQDLLSKYDGVFHLSTVADGAIDYYTLANNSARSETPEEALKRDKLCKDVWVGHPHLRVISNIDNGRVIGFNEKMEKLKVEVYSLLGIPKPLEIEYKYLIERPSDEVLNSLNARVVNIEQVYLKCNKLGVERRVRKRGICGEYSYYYTEKVDISDGVRQELERRISEVEYKKYLDEADEWLDIINKDRYCFLYKDKYFELDIYKWRNSLSILEIELNSKNDKFEIPDGIKIIDDVTNNKAYRNYSIASSRSNDA